MITRHAAAVALLVMAVVLPACITVGPTNPAFPTTEAQANDEWGRMRAAPVALERPVVVIGSYRGPDFHVKNLTRRLQSLTSTRHEDFLHIPAWFDDDLYPVADRAMSMTADRFGTTADGARTVEVDVVGISMGGLVARLAADRDDDERLDGLPRLNIRTLYTIASPHLGASMADKIAIDTAAKQMRTDSDLIASLNDAFPDAEYDLVPYAVLRDGIVGEANTAPPGMTPIWRPGKLWGSHLTVIENRAIIADIARRLRGEEPLGMPDTPLPADDE